MQSTITLTITTGKLSGKKYVFDRRATFMIGRNNDCHLSIPNEFYKRVSRYHCLLNINPPTLRIKDLGSLNGTYINQQKIGQRDSNKSPKEACTLEFPEYDIKDGDEISLGDLVLKVAIENKEPIASPTEIIPSNNKDINSKIENKELVESIAEVIPTSNQVFNSKVNSFDTSEISDIALKIIQLAHSGNSDLQALSSYEIVKLIGKSSFGEVYLAQHSQTGENVAIKLMIPKVEQDELHIKIFLQQLENLLFLKHPNVVNIMDYGYAENIFFFVMEYHKLGNISNLIKQMGGKIPVAMALGIILQVLDGLEFTHNAEVPYIQSTHGTVGNGKGLLHQNLKPENILLSNINRKLVAKIADYGLGKSFYLAGLSGQPFTKIKKEGKPLFIPRQQVVKFRDCKPDVDVWATAACLYNMLTGCYPRDFGHEPWLDVLQNNPVPICKRDPSIPRKLAEVIDLALVEKPHIQFQSAMEFKQALVKAIS
jgi:pSer/pThr/pTyr-binding forkhead associated (FHA) protein